MSNTRFNPFTGLPDYVQSSSTTILVPVGFEAECAASDNVGDPVVLDASVDDRVESLSSNVYDDLVVGIIQTKISTTRCIVIVMGLLVGITTGLTRRKAVFISTTGGLTTTPPPTGHQQIIGQAVNDTDIVININNQKVIQI